MATSKKESPRRSAKGLSALWKPLTSLKLTMVLLTCAMVLVFWGTLAQVEIGLWEAQRAFFRSFFVMWGPEGASWKIPVFPGGYLVGGLLLINLIAAHAYRFKFSSKKAGIFLVHIGLILLLIGQLLTELFQVESSMRLEEGESKNYTEGFRENELAVVDTSDPAVNSVVAIPERLLRNKKIVRHEALPFEIHVKEYFQNSHLADESHGAHDHGGSPLGTGLELKGLGARHTVHSSPTTYRMDERNMPAIAVELVDKQGTSLGNWIYSAWFIRGQEVMVNGTPYEIQLRFKRYYKPHTVHLIDFRHDKYEGTEIPKNFSSLVHVQPDSGDRGFRKKIFMNHPMRHGGETYYQASFDQANPRITVLQVVRNPSWLTPYIACTIVGAGLLLQFITSLSRFLKRSRKA